MAVKLAAWRRDAAERELAEAVQAARDQRLSWRAVGEAIGTSGEAARQRYSSRA
jgi:FAD/FMN-containing dehydrogenase